MRQRATLPAVRILVTLMIGFWVAASSTSCDRNTEAFVEGEKPRAPDLARIFPQSDPSATQPGAGQAMPPSPVPQRGASPVRAPAAPSAPSEMPRSSAAGTGQGEGGANIVGTIRVSQALDSSIPSAGTLFVIARPAGVTAGPPLAVLRVPSPRFPLAFEIGPANVMIPSMRFQGDIGITARLDSDGNAMTKLPGDLEGATRGTHQPGASGVEIVLDTKL
jgi:cytochrome c-type biogenesis protein CcmH